MNREEAFKLTPEISYVIFANGKYRVAYVAEEFGVTWIGIYDEPPSLHTDRIQAGHCEPSLPPAEGAEQLLKRKYADDKWEPNFSGIIEVMTEFAAQPQQTAEGAEEILNKAKAGGVPLTWLITPGYPAWNAILEAMQEYATLHAQRIAEKMVSERLREELMAYDKFLSNTYWGVSHLVKRDEAVDEYLKSREK